MRSILVRRRHSRDAVVERESASPSVAGGASPTATFDLLPWAMCAAASLNIVVNAVFPPGSILLGGFLTVVMVWIARVDLLPAILIAQLTKADFVLTGYGDMSYFITKYEQSAISILGFPVSVNYFLAAAVVARIVWEWLVRPRTYTDRHLSRALTVSWIVAMVLALVMSLQGWAEGNASWTLPLRTVMLGGSILYGLILARSWSESGTRAADLFLVVTTGLLLLALAGRFFNMLLWWFVPLVPGLAVSRMLRPGVLWKMLGAVALLCAVAYGLGLGRSDFRVGDDSGGLTGTGNSTFTLNSLMALSVLLTGLAYLPLASLRRLASSFLGWPAFVAVIAGTFVVVALTPEKGAGSSKWAADPASMTAGERLQAKIFDDRGVIWAAAWDTVSQPPYVLKPSGRPIIMRTRVGESAWTAGAHNSILEMLRLGWVVGVIILLWTLVGLARSARAYGSTEDGSLKPFAIAVICTSTVGMFTGHYPLGDVVIFWFTAAGGLVWGAVSSSAMSAVPAARAAAKRRIVALRSIRSLVHAR